MHLRFRRVGFSKTSLEDNVSTRVHFQLHQQPKQARQAPRWKCMRFIIIDLIRAYSLSSHVALPSLPKAQTDTTFPTHHAHGSEVKSAHQRVLTSVERCMGFSRYWDPAPYIFTSAVRSCTPSDADFRWIYCV